MLTRYTAWLAICLAVLSSMALADEAKVVEELVVYSKGIAQGFRFRAWNMKQAERDGCIYLNEDWKAEPWAGISFTPTEKDKPMLALTPDWIKFGFARFRINGLADAYGSVGAPCTFQFLFQGAAKRYERIPNHFYESGKGIDSDARTWQELWIPLALFDLKPGEKVTALSLQCVLKPTRAFAIESLSLVRFSGPREADRAKAERVVAQPWVTWPEYDELPEALKADTNPPLYRDEKFVTADGRRAFLISTWGREDQRQDLGYNREGKLDWLKRRYGTLDKVNETWGTKHESWDEVKGFKKLNDSPGVFFDYDEYLGDRFTDLVIAGRKEIEAITPGVPVAIQTMGGYCAQPRATPSTCPSSSRTSARCSRRRVAGGGRRT